jgi:hypothetical protein
VAVYWPSGHCVQSVQLLGGSVSTALLHSYDWTPLLLQNATPLVQLKVHEVPLAIVPPRSTHSPDMIDVLNAGSVQLAGAAEGGGSGAWLVMSLTERSKTEGGPRTRFRVCEIVPSARDGLVLHFSHTRAGVARVSTAGHSLCGGASAWGAAVLRRGVVACAGLDERAAAACRRACAVDPCGPVAVN